MPKMTKDTPGPASRASGARSDTSPGPEGASNPLDRWLRRELESLYPDDPSDNLPPQLAELAARLEAALSDPEEGRADDRE